MMIDDDVNHPYHRHPAQFKSHISSSSPPHYHSDHQAVFSGRTFHPLQDPDHLFLLEVPLLCQEGESAMILNAYILFLTSSSSPGSSIPTLGD